MRKGKGREGRRKQKRGGVCCQLQLLTSPVSSSSSSSIGVGAGRDRGIGPPLLGQGDNPPLYAVI